MGEKMPAVPGGVRMTLGSLFDGSGGFPLAGSMCGIEPVWASEIEAYPIRVTAKNFPHMKHLGDIRKISGKEIEPVDVVTFGSPCQDLSVAGKQRGLAGERSGLFMEAVRIIREMREKSYGKYPTFAVWENVPGAFSSNKGEDFRTVLQEIARTAEPGADIPGPPGGKWRNAGEIVGGGFSIAWRVLDAQYWGVPQRRRRIYLVADFRGGRAGKILFERKGLRGDSAQGRETGKRTPGGAENNTGAAGFVGKASGSAGSIGMQEETSPTLRAGVKADVCIYPDTTGTLCASGAGLNRTAGQGNEADFCICIQGNMADRETKMNGSGISENHMYTLNATDHHCICSAAGIDARNGRENGDLCGTLQAKGNGGYSYNTTHPVRIGESTVRRLTPLECCRLQGFPDWWCDGVEGSDSAQYKMWGNGIALPCALYVMEGIAENA